MKFLIVGHNWFVKSNGFDIEEINVENEKAAQNAGHIMRSKKNSVFNSFDFTIIQIADNETYIPEPTNFVYLRYFLVVLATLIVSYFIF
jgi:hypothetical protein